MFSLVPAVRRFRIVDRKNAVVLSGDGFALGDALWVSANGRCGSSADHEGTYALPPGVPLFGDGGDDGVEIVRLEVWRL